MNRNRYDPIKKECLDCGCLLPDRIEDIKEHICSPYVIERKLKDLFGQKPPAEEQIFHLGDEVSAEMMGKIDFIYVKKNGKILYRITDEQRNIHGYFLQSQISQLPIPENNIDYDKDKQEEKVEY